MLYMLRFEGEALKQQQILEFLSTAGIKDRSASWGGFACGAGQQSVAVPRRATKHSCFLSVRGCSPSLIDARATESHIRHRDKKLFACVEAVLQYAGNNQRAGDLYARYRGLWPRFFTSCFLPVCLHLTAIASLGCI